MAHAASPEKEIERNYALGLVCVASLPEMEFPHISQDPIVLVERFLPTPGVRTHTPAPDHRNNTNKIACC